MTTTTLARAGNHMAGEWLSSDACERLAITDPATAETLGSVPLSGRTEVDRAVQAARAAFPSWRRTPVVERARVLFRLKALLDEHHDDLAVSLSREHGRNVAVLALRGGRG